MPQSPFTETEKHDSFLRLQSFLLSTKTPFFIGRLSGNETRFAGQLLSNQRPNDALMQQMLYGAGIQFKSNQDIKDYLYAYMNACKHAHQLGVWDGGMYAQAKPFYDLMPHLFPDLVQICAHALEPFYYMHLPEYQFDRVFENKRVLIITSHEKTTERQIPHVSSLFPKPIFHPTTKIQLYKPAQQNGGNHNDESWVVHFERMKKDLRSLDFDIALVASGGFGMPICDFIYSELNKSCMYVGGALQLFFGIEGSRWKSSPEIQRLKTDKWTQPLPEDRPKRPETCEGGCYW